MEENNKQDIEEIMKEYDGKEISQTDRPTTEEIIKEQEKKRIGK